jgi:calcineurin-like phosphoesterase family protein
VSKTWFTSDTHYGHANIIKHCARPFTSADAMDEALIAAWNARVAPNDVVWHLGDFAFRSATAYTDFLRRLNGRKHLIHGNHDSVQGRVAPGWESSQAYAEITIDSQPLVLFHYALRVWNRVGKGAIHLFGHSHGALLGDRQSCDVGVDAWNYQPVLLDEIKQRLETLPPRVPVDHHD